MTKGVPLRTLMEQLSPPWLGEYWGSRFIGGAISVMVDLLGRGAEIALKCSWLLQKECPPDALPLIGTERSMPRYIADTDDTYRRRLHKAWDTWLFAGTKEGEGDGGVSGQLEAAGYSNTQILNNFDWDFENPKNTDFWSRFVVVIEQPHPFIRWTYGSGPTYGSGHVYGISATIDEICEIRKLIRKWREGHAVNPWIYFVLEAEYYGDPDLVYGGGAVYGGDVMRLPNWATHSYGDGTIYGDGTTYGIGWLC